MKRRPSFAIVFEMGSKECDFVEMVWQYYRQHGRHDLPWRQPSQLKPYNILVSEVMLQQTQVERVLPKYRMFIKAYPNAKRLAAAPLSEVLRHWQGLGYNRRAKLLHQCAKQIPDTCFGMCQSTCHELQQLPVIGPYTAGAIMAFACNQAVPFIETNIRTVYLHHFFSDQSDVSDREILQYIETTLDQENPREWYWALMDYGSHLKRAYGNQNHRSRHHTKQSQFKGSDRQVRGAIVRVLARGGLTRAALRAALKQDLGAQYDTDQVAAQLRSLGDEGLVEQRGQHVRLPN